MDNIDDFLENNFDKANEFLKRLADVNQSKEFADECVRILNDQNALAFIINAATFQNSCNSNPMFHTPYARLYEDIQMALCVQYSVYKKDGELSQFSPQFVRLFEGKSNHDIFEGIILKKLVTQMVAAFIHYDILLEKYPNVISKIK